MPYDHCVLNASHSTHHTLGLHQCGQTVKQEIADAQSVMDNLLKSYEDKCNKVDIKSENPEPPSVSLHPEGLERAQQLPSGNCQLLILVIS